MTIHQIRRAFPYLRFARQGKTLFGKSRVMAHSPGSQYAIRADGKWFEAFADADNIGEAWFLLCKKLIWAGFRVGDRQGKFRKEVNR